MEVKEVEVRKQELELDPFERDLLISLLKSIKVSVQGIEMVHKISELHKKLTDLCNE